VGNILGNFHIHSLIIIDRAFSKNLDLTDFETFFLDYLSGHLDAKQYSLRALDESDIPIIAKHLCKEKNLSLYFPDNFAIEFYRPHLLKRLRSPQGSLIF
jgi:hypothetical protein